jgi:very-short-patch-repair endonuclease
MAYPSKLMRDRARNLRRSQTEAESELWKRLRACQIEHAKFRRQQPIGPFIADFCCMEYRLVVELDGGHHANESETSADQRRTAFLAQRGYRVLRFWDHEVLRDVEAVLDSIVAAIKSPHPDPLPGGEGARVQRE